MERPAAVIQALPERYVFPTAILGLLFGSSLALAAGQVWVGIAGVVCLCLLALTYGALQIADGSP